MDPTTRDRRRVARDPLMAHYGGLATPGPDSPSGPLGPADAHQHSAVETGDAAVRDSVSRHWAFWLIGKDVIRIERESGTWCGRWGGPRAPTLTSRGRWRVVAEKRSLVATRAQRRGRGGAFGGP
jgi:hypothetical protein